MGDNPPKGGLIPRKTTDWNVSGKSSNTLKDGPAAYQAVGEVMAHQADDG